MDINKYSPKGRMSTKHVFSVSDLEEGDIYEILHLARKLKQKQQVKEKLGVFEGKNVAKAENNIYAADTLYRWDVATETMKKVSLIPAAYGLTAESQNAERLYSRLLFAEKYESGNTFEYGNLFYYDIEKDGWVQVMLDASDDGYVLANQEDGAKLTGTALYTYGTPVGAWKYLVTQDGKETSCYVEKIGTLMSNVQANISKLTLRDLYDDGMITITPPDKNTTPEDMLDKEITVGGIPYGTIGSLTLDRMINIIYGIASGNIGTATP